MRYDDYKETMIRFIDEFRIEWKKYLDDNLMKALVNFSCIFVEKSFNGAERNSTDAKKLRKDFSHFDFDKQELQYNISETRGNGKSAVCCERNSTIGNIFQFSGFEVFQVSGKLIYNDEKESNFFTLVKHGPDKGYYSIIDSFNQIIKPKVLPGDYNLSNGFTVNVFSKKHNRMVTYRLDGPLLEITNEIMQIEIELRVKKLPNIIDISIVSENIGLYYLTNFV